VRRTCDRGYDIRRIGHSSGTAFEFTSVGDNHGPQSTENDLPKRDVDECRASSRRQPSPAELVAAAGAERPDQSKNVEVSVGAPNHGDT